MSTHTKKLSLTSQQAVLVYILPVIVLLLIGIFPLFTYYGGKVWGYLAALTFYWLGVCLLLPMYLIGRKGMVEIYKSSTSQLPKPKYAYILLLLVPIALTFGAVFLKKYEVIGINVMLLAALFAVINGTCEEVLWRGTFIHLFPNRIHFAFTYGTILFTLWHIAMALAIGISYEGGALNLIGGALFLGCIWGWYTWKSKSILLVTISHVVTNFFAFTGLIYDNYFM